MGSARQRRQGDTSTAGGIFMTGTCGQGLDTSFVALGYGKVATLGVVQGITELMPISSSAHMRMAAGKVYEKSSGPWGGAYCTYGPPK